MKLAEITDTDPALGQWLMKLHKGAVAGFNAKTTAAILGLFNGWKIEKAVFIKPSDELGYNSGFRADTEVHTEEYSETFKQMRPWKISLIGSSADADLRFTMPSHTKKEAELLHASVGKYAVAKLPDPKKAKADDYFVMDLTDPKAEKVRDNYSGDDKLVTRWLWSFRLFRKCSGYHITAPDGKSFDVCGPVQILGYGGTKDFAAFFKWALAETNLESEVNERLGLVKHVKASERPRVPVGGQTIGHCAICMREQVVRHDVMVLHGYQRPGHGYIIGNCFGVDYKPYEVSAEACVAYLPVLHQHKTNQEKRLNDLNSGRIKALSRTKYNYLYQTRRSHCCQKGRP